MELIHRRATVAELHGLDPWASGPLPAQMWWCDPIDRAVVLGSRQSPEIVDAERCRAEGLTVVRRRSGGGAVLVEAGEMTWVDLVLPHGVAPDDVRGSMVWAGERWQAALAALGVTGIELHTGGMVCSPWSGLVCFAGIGPGELLLDGHKLLGLSQRRTRHGLRIQGSLYRRHPGVRLPELLLGELPDVPLAAVATLDLDPQRIVAALGDDFAGVA